MTIRDLIPWGRQNRVPMRYEREEMHPIVTLHREMNRLFDDVFRSFEMPGLPLLARGGAAWPSIEVSESDREFRVIAEVPGLTEKDIELTVDEGLLTLRGERRSETEDKERGYSERFYGRFERHIALPAGVQEDAIAARFENGVLTVTAPKSPDARSRGRRIEIATADTRH